MTKKYNISKFLMVVLLGFASLNAMPKGSRAMPKGSRGQDSLTNVTDNIVGDNASSYAGTGVDVGVSSGTSVAANTESKSDSAIIEILKNLDAGEINVDYLKTQFNFTEDNINRLNHSNLIVFNFNGSLYQVYCKNGIFYVKEINDQFFQSDVSTTFLMKSTSESVEDFVKKLNHINDQDKTTIINNMNDIINGKKSRSDEVVASSFAEKKETDADVVSNVQGNLHQSIHVVPAEDDLSTEAGTHVDAVNNAASSVGGVGTSANDGLIIKNIVDDSSTEAGTHVDAVNNAASSVGGVGTSANDSLIIQNIFNDPVVKARMRGDSDEYIMNLPVMKELKQNDSEKEDKDLIQNHLNHLVGNRSLHLEKDGNLYELIENSGLKSKTLITNSKMLVVINSFSINNKLEDDFIIDKVSALNPANAKQAGVKLDPVQANAKPAGVKDPVQAQEAREKSINGMSGGSRYCGVNFSQRSSNSNLGVSSPNLGRSSPNLGRSSPNLVRSSLNLDRSSPNLGRSSPNLIPTSVPSQKNFNLEEQYKSNFLKESVFGILGGSYKLTDVFSFLYLGSISIEEQRGILGINYTINDILSFYLSGIITHRNGSFVESLGEKNIFGVGGMIGFIVNLIPNFKLCISVGVVKYKNGYSWVLLTAPMYSHSISDSVDLFIGLGVFNNSDNVDKDSKDSKDNK